MSLFVLFLLGVFGLVGFVSPTQATTSTNSCRYSSTEARVKLKGSSDWHKNLDIGCKKHFKMGSFHDGVLDDYAQDTVFEVVYPDGTSDRMIFWRGNGKTIKADKNGVYTIKVSTKRQDGVACADVATVVRNCGGHGHYPQPTMLPVPEPTERPTPPPGGNHDRCEYSSTQARVQRNEKEHWTENLELKCGESFRVGGFHNGTGLFSDDTILTVTTTFNLPVKGEVSYKKVFQNGDTVLTAPFSANYRLDVTTPGQGGAACMDTARVSVSCSGWFDWLRGWEKV